MEPGGEERRVLAWMFLGEKNDVQLMGRFLLHRQAPWSLAYCRSFCTVDFEFRFCLYDNSYSFSYPGNGNRGGHLFCETGRGPPPVVKFSVPMPSLYSGMRRVRPTLYGNCLTFNRGFFCGLLNFIFSPLCHRLVFCLD